MFCLSRNLICDGVCTSLCASVVGVWLTAGWWPLVACIDGSSGGGGAGGCSVGLM